MEPILSTHNIKMFSAINIDDEVHFDVYPPPTVPTAEVEPLGFFIRFKKFIVNAMTNVFACGWTGIKQPAAVEMVEIKKDICLV